MRVFCISGLGADHRSFGRLNLEAHTLLPVPWIANKPAESLADYALRLAATIDSSEPFALLGLSFGGMLAIEMASTIKPRHLVLLSSAASPEELPRAYRWANRMHLQQLIPDKLIVSPSRIAHWHMGVRKEQDKQLLNAILHDTDPSFAKWAIGAITGWKKRNDRSCVRIHGVDDNILPCPMEALTIDHAGHLAVFTHAQQVAEHLARILA